MRFQSMQVSLHRLLSLLFLLIQLCSYDLPYCPRLHTLLIRLMLLLPPNQDPILPKNIFTKNMFTKNLRPTQAHTRLITDCQSLKYFLLTSSGLLNVSWTLSHGFFFIWNFCSLVLKQWLQRQLRANVASFVLQPRLLRFYKIALEGEVICL